MLLPRLRGLLLMRPDRLPQRCLSDPFYLRGAVYSEDIGLHDARASAVQFDYVRVLLTRALFTTSRTRTQRCSSTRPAKRLSTPRAASNPLKKPSTETMLGGEAQTIAFSDKRSVDLPSKGFISRRKP